MGAQSDYEDMGFIPCGIREAVGTMIKTAWFTSAGIVMAVGTMAPDATIDFIIQPSHTKGRLRVSRHYRFNHDKVTIFDRQSEDTVELTEQEAQILLDDLIACLVKPTLPGRWWDRAKFLFRLIRSWGE